MRWLLLFFGLLGTPAFAAEQFDLVCTAKKQNERYRVDLVRNEWCYGKCENVLKIVRSTSGEIVFAEHVEAFPGDYIAYNRVNRVTGAWEWYNYEPGSYPAQNIKGSCQSEPFSGLPISKF